MTAMEVHDPSGAVEVERLHAARLESLEGKTVAFLSDDMWQAHRMFPVLEEALGARFPGVKVIRETEFPMGNTRIDTDETADLVVASGADAAIVGNAA